VKPVREKMVPPTATELQSQKANLGRLAADLDVTTRVLADVLIPYELKVIGESVINARIRVPLDDRLLLRIPGGRGRGRENWFKIRDWVGKKVRYEWDDEAQSWRMARKYAWTVVKAMSTSEPWNIEVLWQTVVGTEKCDTRCREAQLEECVCQCAGVHHMELYWRSPWALVGDTTLIKPGDRVWLRRVVLSDLG
jgi:hypothetical protein